jgi:hypothetical protein
MVYYKKKVWKAQCPISQKLAKLQVFRCKSNFFTIQLEHYAIILKKTRNFSNLEKKGFSIETNLGFQVIRHMAYYMSNKLKNSQSKQVFPLKIRKLIQ